MLFRGARKRELGTHNHRRQLCEERGNCRRAQQLPTVVGSPLSRGRHRIIVAPRLSGTTAFRTKSRADQQKRQTPHDAQQPPQPQPPQPTPQPPTKPKPNKPRPTPTPTQPQPPQPQPLQPQPRHPKPTPTAPQPRKPPPPQPRQPPQPPPRAICVKPAVPVSLSKRWNVARLTSAISSSPRMMR